ncbi:hypothetical protein JCM14469_14570 [Desulfatiferula olefinivorans]
MIRDMLKRWVGGIGLVLSGLLCVSCTARSADRAAEPRPPQAGDMNRQLETAFNKVRDTGQASIDVWPGEDPELVQTGDLAAITYVLTLDDGTLIRTNVREAAERHGRLGDSGVIYYYPDPVMVGTGEKHMDISDQVIGMKPGESRRIVLTPENGGLPVAPDNIKRFTRKRDMPAFMSMALADFRRQFKTEPAPGVAIPVTPYFMSTVRGVRDDQVYIDSDITEEKTVTDTLGRTRIMREGDDIVLELTPTVGAPFETGGMSGRITAVDDTHFTVDFNPPLAGKTLFMDLTIDSLIKASALHGRSIEWTRDYDEGVALSMAEQRPMVLFLYREGCPWCERMEKGVFPDPRLQSLSEDFVWVSVNSGVRTDIKELFGQEGFPMTVLLNPDQTIYRELKGFRDPGRLRQELLMWHDDRLAGMTVYGGETAEPGSGHCDE